MTTSTQPVPSPKKALSASALFRRSMLLIVGFTVFIFMIGMLLIIEASPISLLPDQVSIIGDIFFIILMLCPLILCGLPLYFALCAGVYGIIRLDSGTTFRLRKLQITSKKAQERVEKVTTSLGKRSIQINSRGAFLRPLFRIFDHPEDKKDDKK